MTIKLDDRNPLTNADFLITFANVPGYFHKFSGIKKKFSRAPFSDGLSNIKRFASSGAVEFENATVNRSFDPIVDDPLIGFLLLHECGEIFDVSIVPVKRCGGVVKRGTKSWSLSNCKIVQYDVAEADTSDGSKVSDLVIIFSFDSASWS